VGFGPRARGRETTGTELLVTDRRTTTREHGAGHLDLVFIFHGLNINFPPEVLAAATSNAMQGGNS